MGFIFVTGDSDSGGGGTPGGSDGQLQYNSSGAFAGTDITYSEPSGIPQFSLGLSQSFTFFFSTGQAFRVQSVGSTFSITPNSNSVEVKAQSAALVLAGSTVTISVGGSSYNLPGTTPGAYNVMSTDGSGSVVWVSAMTVASVTTTNTTTQTLQVNGGNIGTDQTAAATTLGNVVGSLPIYGSDGTTLVGYLPIYDSIT